MVSTKNEHPGWAVFIEQRNSTRRVLKTRAVAVFTGVAPITARTIDVSGNGISLSMDRQIPQGLECDLSFELFLDGQMKPVKTRSKVMYCIVSNGEYKVGFHFLNLELSAMTLLAKFLR